MVDQENDPELYDLTAAAAAVYLAARRAGLRCGLQNSFQIEAASAEYLASGMEVPASDPAPSDQLGVFSTVCPVAEMVVLGSDPQMSSQPVTASAECLVLMRVVPIGGPVK